MARSCTKSMEEVIMNELKGCLVDLLVVDVFSFLRKGDSVGGVFFFNEQIEMIIRSGVRCPVESLTVSALDHDNHEFFYAAADTNSVISVRKKSWSLHLLM